MRVAIEAGCEQGWHKYVGCDGVVVAINSFGASAPAKVLADHFGFTPEKVIGRIEEALRA